MKLAFALLALVFVTQAQASSELPGRLDCKAIKATAVTRFSIYGIGSESPRSSFRDASFIDKSVRGGKITVGFSNQCDNSYEVTFKVADLRNLEAGEWVKGQLTYFNSDLGDELGDNMPEGGETVLVVCKR